MSQVTVPDPTRNADGTDNAAGMRAEIDRINAEKAATESTLAMTTAKVNLDSPVGQMFSEHYSGDLAPEAIATAAAAVGALTEAAPPTGTAPTVQVAPGETGSTDERNALASGATGEQKPAPPDPRQVAAKTVEDQIKAGRSRGDALGAGFEALVSGAVNGDERVIVNAWGDRSR